MLKKLLSLMLMITLNIVLCTGCIKNTAGDTGSENANTNVASGSAVVSSVAISESPENNETDSSYYPCANDEFLYCRYKETLFQSCRWNKQGLDRINWFYDIDEWDTILEVPSKFSELLYVTNAWLYYSYDIIEDDYEKTVIYRVPLKRKKNIEKPIWKKKEYLMTVDGYFDGPNFYTNDTYVIFIISASDDLQYSLYKFDLTTKKKELIKKLSQNWLVQFYDNNYSLIHIGKKLLINESVGNTEENIWLLDPEKGEMKKILSFHGSQWLEVLAVKGQQFFYCYNDEIYCYDILKGKSICLAMKNTINTTLKELFLNSEKIHLQCYELSDGFIYNNKLYMAVDVYGNRQETVRDGEKTKKKITREYDRQILLCIDTEYQNDIQIEAELYNYLEKNDPFIKDVYEGEYIAETYSEYAGHVHKRCIIEMENNYIQYNLDTKEITEFIL